MVRFKAQVVLNVMHHAMFLKKEIIWKWILLGGKRKWYKLLKFNLGEVF